MKPKSGSIAATSSFFSNATLRIFASLCALGTASAADGVWTSTTTGGTWSNAANWSGGVVADGSTFLADLTSVDLPAGAFTVTLDSNRTIGSISFNDADAVTTVGTWNLAGTATLTLSGGTPTLTAGVTTTVAPVIAGSAGFTKAGAANLVLTNANTITGGISVATGQLTSKNGAALGANTLTLANGTTYRYERTTANASTFPGNAISVAAASSVTITTDNAANGYGGIITGDANSTVTIGATGNLAQCSFSLGANTQQFGPFLGRVEIFDGASIRFSSTSGVNNGGASAIWDTNTSGNITTRNAATVHFGSLVGNGTVSGSSGATGTAIFSVGARNEACTFGGVISDGNTGSGRIGRLTKTGTAKFTLTGANTYTGQTNVDAGTLEIGNGGGTGSIGATNVNVAASANLHLNPGSAQVQTISGIVAGAGTITKFGPGRTNLNGINTFTTSPVIEAGTLSINADSGLGAAANSVTFQNGSGKLGSDAAGIVTARAINISAGATGGFAAIDATDSLRVDGVVSGDGSLEIGGNGLVSLTAANLYAGNTTVASGVFAVSNTSGSATSAGSVAVNGGTLAGTGIIAGSTSLASGASLKPGAITTSSTSVGTLTTGTLDLNAGSTLYTEFANSSSYDTVVVNGDVLATGASVSSPVLVDLRSENSVAKWTSLGTYNLIQYTGNFSGNADDLFEVTASSKQAGLVYTFGTSGGFITLTIAGAPPSEWNVDASGNWSTAGNWLNGVPDTAGATAKFGTVITGPVTATVDSPKTVGSIQFNNANSYTVGGASTLTLDSTTGNAAIEILAGSHQIAAPLAIADSLDLSFLNATNTLTVSGDISGAGGINNATAGGLVLTGNNSFAGNIAFTSGSLTFESGALGTGTLSLANSSLVWATGNTEDISTRSVSVGGTSVTMNTNGNNVLLANPIGAAGTGALVKTGDGTLTIAGNSTYTGLTTISGGTLQLGSGGATGGVNGTITNQSALRVNLAGGATLANLVTGTGSFEHAGAGTLTLSAQNTFNGVTTISSATGVLALTDALNLQNSTLSYLSTGGSLGLGSLTAVTLGGLSGDRNLTLENTVPAALTLTVGGNNASTTYSGSLSGAGSLVKNGTGILSLGGANTYTGTTVINAGDLEIIDGGSIGSTTSVATAATGRMVVFNGTLTAPIGTFGVGSPGLLVNGGTATFSGAVTAAGSTGSTNSGLVKVTDGSLSMQSLALGRGGLNASAEPGVAPADTNLYISGGSVSISGNLNIGTANNVPNSSVVTRVDGGTLTVGGAISVGLNNGGRWSILDVNGGELISTATAVNSGIVLGGPWQGNAIFLMRGGVATAERIQLGQGAIAGTSVVNVSGGQLYLGSQGVVVGTTATTFVPEIRLTGGTLAAKQAWSTSVPVNVTGTNTSTIQTEDASGTPFDITFTGPLSGTGSFNKTGAGTLTLSAVNTHSGNTNVLAGVLKTQTRSFADDALVSVDLAVGAALNLDFTGGDKVGSFLIDGNTQADGIYGSLTNTTPGITQTAAITGPGLLYVNVDPPSSAFATWASANGLTAGVNDGPTQDPDNDGIENVLEFVLGGLPLTPNTGILPTLNASGSNFVFSFNRSDESEAEVALNFQHGTDLSSWTDVAIGAVDTLPVVSVTENGASADLITVTIPKGANSRLFGRLQGTK